mgnify:CR=1 FL=1|tara:strand:+ start:2556 stop:3524 length:969 start_codon:yes stop_codon:yes gene_type:complete
MEILRYTNIYKEQWNSFIETSKNGTFLLQRSFMEYHQDRFEDFSLLVLKKGKILAVLPANITNNIVCSHQGLTYGGIILIENLDFNSYKDILIAVLKFLNKQDIKQLKIKLIPDIYNLSACDEIKSILPILNSTLIRSEVSLATTIKPIYSFSKLRLRGVKKGIKNKLIIKETHNLEPFWNQILVPNLLEKHKTNPTHNLREIALLKELFPDEIRQFEVYFDDQIIAGATIFETQQTAHSQYISGKQEFNHLGGLDLLFHELITNVFKDKKYFNFGTSTATSENKINKGLFNWKQGFDTSPILQNQFSIDTRNYKNLETLFV